MKMSEVSTSTDGGSSFLMGIKYQRMDPDEETRNSRTRRYVMLCAFIASLNNVLLGYNVGVMSGAVLFIQQDLKITEVQTEILIGSLNFIAFFGSLVGGRTSDSIGRKWTMVLAALVFQAGAAVMAIAPSFEVLMIGRIINGFGMGLGVMITPVYIAEISPSVTRGFLTSFPEIITNVGIVLGYVSNYAFSGLSVHISWRVMLAVGILPSVFIGIAMCVIPESPRWLVMKGQVERAREVLINTNDRDEQVKERLAEIEIAAINTQGSQKTRAVWHELLSPSPVVLKMLIVGFGIQCFQQITGIEATVYYSPTILKKAGIQDETKLLAATIAVGVTKTVFILIPTFLIDSVGRKPLLYVSTIGMTLCLFSLSFTLTFVGQGTIGINLGLLFVCGIVSFFSVGIGPVCWVLTSEIFPLRLRAQASALGAVGNSVCSGLVAMSFLSVSRAITVQGTFFIFSILSALSVIFVYSLVPETSGKTLEQIELMFESGLKREGNNVEHLLHKDQEF